MSVKADSASLTFRRASAGDVDLLKTLADRIWRHSYASLLSAAQIDHMLARMYGAEVIAAEMAGGVVWDLATLDGAPVGYLSVVPAPGAQSELKKLYLEPALQGRGHGQTMLARALAVARDAGSPGLRLRVNKGNARALRAYGRAGFQVVDAIVEDIGGGFVMDDFVLARSVDGALSATDGTPSGPLP